jgi:hypothetical protein
MGAIVAIVLATLAAVGWYEYRQSSSPGSASSGDSAADSSQLSGSVTTDAGSSDGSSSAGDGSVNSSVDPSDESTWPAGDPFYAIAHAIAKAEGYGPAGNVPTTHHNPGDLSDGAAQFGSNFHSGSNVTTFPDDETGWGWLHDKLANIYAGKSASYPQNSTWTEIAQKWAGDWQNWLNNVTSNLGVDPNDTLANFVESWTS